MKGALSCDMGVAPGKKEPWKTWRRSPLVGYMYSPLVGYMLVFQGTPPVLLGCHHPFSPHTLTSPLRGPKTAFLPGPTLTVWPLAMTIMEVIFDVGAVGMAVTCKGSALSCLL